MCPTRTYSRQPTREHAYCRPQISFLRKLKVRVDVCRESTSFRCQVLEEPQSRLYVHPYLRLVSPGPYTRQEN